MMSQHKGRTSNAYKNSQAGTQYEGMFSTFLRAGATIGTLFFPSLSTDTQCNKLDKLHNDRVRRHQEFLEQREVTDAIIDEKIAQLKS